MNKKNKDRNILFVQDSSPCIRTLKIAAALEKKGLIMHLAFKNKSPHEVYGYGDSIFNSMTRLSNNIQETITTTEELINSKKIDLVHFHNQPDIVGAGLIEASLSVPVVYDQHDFMSFKHKLSRKDKRAEKICNEEADGTVYITDSYKNEVAQYYSLLQNSINFANYFPAESSLHPDDFLPKLSEKDGRLHLVYIGRISEHRHDHRNIIKTLKELYREEIIIHLYPSKNKKYNKYRKLKNVMLHKKLPYKKLIQEISQYDYGMTVFNNNVASKLPHIRFAFGNKSYDYICAGIPILVQKCLDEVRDFTLSNNFGYILEQQEKYLHLNRSEYNAMVNNIINKRQSFSMEHQIQRMIDFYEVTLERFHAKT